MRTTWISARLLPLVLLAVSDPTSPPPPPPTSILVLTTGQALEVRGYTVEGPLVQIVGLDGTRFVLRADLLDAEASRNATARVRSRPGTVSEATPEPDGVRQCGPAIPDSRPGRRGPSAAAARPPAPAGKAPPPATVVLRRKLKQKEVEDLIRKAKREQAPAPARTR